MAYVDVKSLAFNKTIFTLLETWEGFIDYI